MNPKISVSRELRARARGATAVFCSVLIACGDSIFFTQNISFAQTANAGTTGSARLSNEQLDSLVAPIALFPDGLLAQVLAASTYPLEIVQLSQWLDKNKGLQPGQVTAAVQNQGWDPSVQAMATFPDVVKNMTENIGWTNDLGNAFLAQQNDVMDAVQRMRTKAMNAGKLQTTQQQTVQTQTIGDRSVVVIEPANPQVVYVPVYEPAAIWGAPAYYPYPPIYYPPGYAVAASAISFGVGVAIGAAWGGGGWGWRPGWGGNNIIINNNNAFVRHYNNNRINGGNRYAGNGNNWRHNPAHRGGAPYGDRSTAQRFGGAARGDNLTNRQNAARQNIGRGQGTANRFGGGATPGNAIGAGGNRGPGAGNAIGGGNRGPGAGAGIGGNRGPGAGGGIGAGAGVGGANRMAPGGMGGDRIGNRQTSRPSVGQSPFGGAGMGGFGARQSGQRGRSSMGGFGGGGMRGRGFGGGGMRGGGMRGGGRRR